MTIGSVSKFFFVFVLLWHFAGSVVWNVNMASDSGQNTFYMLYHGDNTVQSKFVMLEMRLIFWPASVENWFTFS